MYMLNTSLFLLWSLRIDPSLILAVKSEHGVLTFGSYFTLFQLDKCLCECHSSYRFTREKGHLAPVQIIEVING